MVGQEVLVDVDDLADAGRGRARASRSRRSRNMRFFTNSMRSFGACAPYPSSFETRPCSSSTISVGRHLRRVLHRLVELEVLEHGGEVGVGRERTEVAQRRELSLDVARRAGEEQPQERESLRLGEAAGDPEVEEHGAPARLDEEVPAVQVAVEDAVEHGALEAARSSPARRTAVVSTPASCIACDVVEREALEALHDEHPLRDQAGMRPRHDHRALLGQREHPGQVEHVLGLETEVELLDDLLGEELDERRRVRQRRHRDAPDEMGRQPGEGARRRRASSASTRGRCTFTTTSSPVTSRAAWTWAIDAAAIGRSSKCANTVSSGAPRSPSTTRRMACVRLGRDLVAQLLELGHQLVGEQALERRDDLAELHVGRAELLERPPQPPREPGPRARRPALADVPDAEGPARGRAATG